MKGKKNKPANIIKKSTEVIHACDIGLQPELNKKKLITYEINQLGNYLIMRLLNYAIN